jgi:hypothetical protein
VAHFTGCGEGGKVPKQYEAMRDKFIKEGMSKEKAQEHAAKIYNSKGKGHVGKGSK